MPLAAGSRLGPYEVQAMLGEGGMGEVYRARDTRLDRTVAIKIVRAGFSERFEREAKSISALNHANICTLHDVGHTDEFPYLVMEYIDGTPIKGPLPIGETLKLGIQICDALHAAHQKGIVHRDLKPANIMMSKAGIKLLDFGLAKAQTPASSAVDAQATVSALTGAHTVVGTPQYMAPEQIEGREIDARADIFALGCVLYELVTGKRAFDGKSATSVMAAILATEPRKPSELVPVTPPQLEWIILRCLQKDPDARFQSARDVGLQLQWIGEQPATASAAGDSGRRSLLTGAAAGILVAAIVAGIGIWSGSLAPAASSGSRDRIAMSVRTPEKVALTSRGQGSAVAVSPDGRSIAFLADSASEGSAIYLRALDAFEPVKVEGTDGASGVFFSPDGSWIGFSADGRLRKVPVGGGAAIEICDAQGLRGSAWLADDSIVFTPAPTGGLMRVSAQGGTPAAFTTLDASKNERTHRSPIGLPGGKVVVFVIGSNEIDSYDDGRIVALTVATGQVTELVKGYAPAFSATGHLLYMREGTVFAVPFDPATLKVGGSPVQVVKNVSTLPGWGTADIGVSATGVLAYVPGGDRTELSDIHLLYRNGHLESTAAQSRPFGGIRMSPDGRRLAVQMVGANNAIWTYDIEQRQLNRITNRLDVEGITWSHDGSRVTYSSGPDVRMVAVDGSGSDEVLIPASVVNGRSFTPVRWSKDGQALALTIYEPGKGGEIAVFTPRDRNVRTVISSRYFERAADLSPDGRWLAYLSSDTGSRRLYVYDLESGTRHAVPGRNAGDAAWTKGGRELFSVGADGAFALPFTPGTPPSFGKPERLFTQAKPEDLGEGSGGDAAPDGSRFAVSLFKPRPRLTDIRLVTDWARQLSDVSR